MAPQQALFLGPETFPASSSEKRLPQERVVKINSNPSSYFSRYVFVCFRESCGEGTVKILEERLKEMGFQYSCINDYL